MAGGQTRANCPPGLAKKNNGCLPPGQASKRSDTRVTRTTPHEALALVGDPSACASRAQVWGGPLPLRVLPG